MIFQTFMDVSACSGRSLGWRNGDVDRWDSVGGGMATHADTQLSNAAG